MKTGRSVVLVAASASMLVAGWAAGSGFLSPTGATNSASGANLGGSTQGTSGATAGTSGDRRGREQPRRPRRAPPPHPPQRAGSSTAAPCAPATAPSKSEITVAAGKITDISMLQSGDQDGTSRQITAYALPLLIQAVLQQQKANVGYVSGASYTTQGFEGAVQSAMQAAGLA